MSETADARLKRLSMRAHRRGMREMDLILGQFADERLVGFDAETLDAFEALLDEADQDLYLWVTGKVAAPDHVSDMVTQVAAHLKAVPLRPGGA